MMSAAFEPSDYMYPSEDNVTISYVDFSDNGHSYTIVKLNDVDTFFLKDEVLVTDQSEIESLIYNYYVKEHYPSEEELEDLRSLITRFNDVQDL